MGEVRAHGWGMVSRPNSAFPVIFFFNFYFYGGQGGKERKERTLLLPLLWLWFLKPLKKEPSLWHPAVSTMGSQWLVGPSVTCWVLFLFCAQSWRAAREPCLQDAHGLEHSGRGLEHSGRTGCREDSQLNMYLWQRVTSGLMAQPGLLRGARIGYLSRNCGTDTHACTHVRTHAHVFIHVHTHTWCFLCSTLWPKYS